MNEKNNLITGSVGKVMMRFVLQELRACFMQTLQNMGAGKPDRARKSLGYGLVMSVGWGQLCSVYNQLFP